MAATPLNIVICGSGNGAQTAAGVLGAAGHRVTLLFSPEFAPFAPPLQAALDANGGAVTLRYPSTTALAREVRGRVAGGAATNAAAAVPSADVVIVCVSGPFVAGTFRQLAPFLDSRQLLVLMPGMGAVNERQLEGAVAAAAAEHDAARGPAGRRPAVPMFIATQTLPWACRLTAPAIADVCGTKAEVHCVAGSRGGALVGAMAPQLLDALFPGTHFEPISPPLWRSCLPFDLLGNPVLHPGIMYGAWKDWDGQPLSERPPFYMGCTDAAVAAVEGMQAEAVAVITALCATLGLPYPTEIKDIRSDLEICYGNAISDPSTLGSLLRTNRAYEGIRHPMRPAPGPAGAAGGLVPDWSARVLTEDVPCGLCPLRGAAQILGVPTPWVDEVIGWAQARMGKEYLVGGRLAGRDVAETDAPQAYGAQAPEDLLLFPCARALEMSAGGAAPAAGAFEMSAGGAAAAGMPAAACVPAAAAATAAAESVPLVFSH